MSKAQNRQWREKKRKGNMTPQKANNYIRGFGGK
jgi:hypothetical protein